MQRVEPVLHEQRDRLELMRAGGGERGALAEQRARIGHQDEVRGHRRGGAGDDADQLRPELLARIGAEQVTGLEVVEQIGARDRRGVRHRRGHQIRRRVLGAQHAERQLGQLPHRTAGRDVGLAGDPARDRAEHQRHRHREHPERDRDVEQRLAERDRGGTGEREAAPEPAHRDLDRRRWISRARGEQAGERAPVREQRHGRVRDQQRRAEPEADLEPRERRMRRGPRVDRQRAEAERGDRAADDHPRGDPEADERAGRDQQDAVIEDQPVLARALAEHARAGGDPAEQIAPDREQRAAADRGEHQPRLRAHRSGGPGEPMQHHGGGRTRGEREALAIDQLALERDREHHPERGDARDPGGERERAALLPGGMRGRHRQQQQRGDHADHHVAGGVGGGRGGRLHAAGLEHRQRRARGADRGEAAPARDRDQDRRERHAEEPAGLEPDIDVREREHEAEQEAGRDRAHRQLRLGGSVDVAVPRRLVQRRDLARVENDAIIISRCIGISQIASRRHEA